MKYREIEKKVFTIKETTNEKKIKYHAFNGLTPKEWASLSKNIWNDISSPRDKHHIEHGATFPVALPERLIKMYSKKGDWVLDPFLGVGATLLAAQKLERNGIGIELNHRFVEISKELLSANSTFFSSKYTYNIFEDDCRNMRKYMQDDFIQLTVTSPPYANFIRRSIKDRKETHTNSLITKDNNSFIKPYSDDPRDFGNLPYKKFLCELLSVLRDNYIVTKPGGYSAWVVKDYRDTYNGIPYIAFHSDLAKIGEEVGFKFHDLIIWDQTGQRKLVLLGFPSVFYTNQNCSFIVIFRKPIR
ncbi:MAG TPA: DNA methyltransferase [Candidatus Hydrogenedens sp.]|nr:DNA methyltransferase [Candidatus Hydrogenedens sp.]